MRSRFWGVAFAMLLPAAAAAQPLTATPQKPAEVTPISQLEPADGARRISGAEAIAAVAKGNAVLIDVRPKDAYEASHAKGAKNIPLNELPSHLSELPKDKLIITYCT